MIRTDLFPYHHIQIIHIIHIIPALETAVLFAPKTGLTAVLKGQGQHTSTINTIVRWASNYKPAVMIGTCSFILPFLLLVLLLQLNATDYRVTRSFTLTTET